MRQNTPRIRFKFLLTLMLVLANVLFAQKSVNLTDMELAVQVQFYSTVIAELTNISDAYSYKASDCDELLVYTSNNPNISTSTIVGPYFNSKKGFSIEEYGKTATEEMRHSLNKVKFKLSQYPNLYMEHSEGEELYFIYDTRDCNYYSACPESGTQDVTIRLTNNGSYYQVWFKKYHPTDSTPPSSSTGWVDVSQSTYRCWNVMGNTHCDLNWENLAPNAPQNLQLSGSAGANPTITWQQNKEPDLDGYKIYRSENGQSYNLLFRVGESVTSYTDSEVTIGSSKFDPTVCYKVRAYDTDNLESQLSTSACTRYSAINKRTVDLDAKIEYNLSNPYPNPFNPSTKINYSIKRAGNAQIVLYDILGNTIKILLDEYLSEGNYTLVLNSSMLASGIYFYSFSVNNYFDIKKMQVIK